MSVDASCLAVWMGYGACDFRKSVQSDLKSMNTENKYFQITYEGMQISKGQGKSIRAEKRHKSWNTSLGDGQTLIGRWTLLLFSQTHLHWLWQCLRNRSQIAAVRARHLPHVLLFPVGGGLVCRGKEEASRECGEQARPCKKRDRHLSVFSGELQIEYQTYNCLFHIQIVLWFFSILNVI